MDKTQKELIKTYFRKRGIAAETDSNRYKKYELSDEIINSGLLKINPDTIDPRRLNYLIHRDPNYLKNILIKFDLTELGEEYYRQLLNKNPSFYWDIRDVYNETWAKNKSKMHRFNDNFSVYDSIKYMHEEPKLIDEFGNEEYGENKFQKMSGDDVTPLLIKHHKMYADTIFKYFNPRFFFETEIFKILLNVPDLINYFKDKLKEIRDIHIYELVGKHPSIRDIFKPHIDYPDHTFEDLSDVLETIPTNIDGEEIDKDLIKKGFKLINNG